VVPHDLDNEHSVLRTCIQHTDLLVNTELQYISSNLQSIGKEVRLEQSIEEDLLQGLQLSACIRVYFAKRLEERRKGSRLKALTQRH
jgi:hypothetical protein